MKFHCKQSPSSRSPQRQAVGSIPLLPGPHSRPALLGDGDMGQQPHYPVLARLPPRPPAHSSLHTLPTKGLLSPSPRLTQRPECCHGIETPPEKSTGSRVTEHSPGACILALGQSPECQMSREYRKNKESVPAITGFSNLDSQLWPTVLFLQGYFYFRRTLGQIQQSLSSARRYLKISLNWLYLKALPPAHFS